ncbi:Ca2+ regulator and membrane fusion protein Fig1-domain-containing protein [Biscogniauxia sp. FL1348]|nr:Ca2+ regulator and membrane fusion protein Fig1-domain-containing protein [Biscogniauxia sp. FL1348]
MFRVLWQRVIPPVSYNHILMMFNICAIVFWSFLLASCTSSNDLKNVHLVSLAYKSPAASTSDDPLLLNSNVSHILSEQLYNSEKMIQQIHVGYLSICMALNSGIWVCSSDADELATSVKEAGDGDPLNLLRFADNLRQGVVFYALIIIAIILTFLSFLLLATFPGWQTEEDSEGSEREVKPFPPRPITMTIAALMSIASALGFVSAFWQHIGAAGASTLLKLLTYDMAEAQIGAAAMTLGWLGASCACVTTIGMVIMILSIQLLSQLTS